MSSPDYSFPSTFPSALRMSLSAQRKGMPASGGQAQLLSRIHGWFRPWPSIKTAAPLAVAMLSLLVLRRCGVDVPSPGLLLLAAIVCTGFWSGMHAGLIATTFSILYELAAFSDRGHLFWYTSENAIRIGIFSISASIAAILVGILRKRVETATYALAHRRAIENWQAERASLESVLHQLPMGVLVADAASHEITFANERARAILGSDVRRLHSVGFPTMNHIDSGRSYSPDEWPLRRCVQTRMAIDEEFLYARDNGQLVILHSRTCPIYEQGGEVVAAVMSLTELAEKRQMEQKRAAINMRWDGALDLSA